MFGFYPYKNTSNFKVIGDHKKFVKDRLCENCVTKLKWNTGVPTKGILKRMDGKDKKKQKEI